MPKDPSLLAEHILLAELDEDNIPGELTREIDGSFVISVELAYNDKVKKIYDMYLDLKKYYNSPDYDWLLNLQFVQSPLGSVFYYNPNHTEIDED